MKTLVIALGGNALIQSHQVGKYEEQLQNVKRACAPIAQLAKQGYAIVITHGNGPQVGNLEIEMSCARERVPPMPLHVAVAMTQAEIGYLIQQQLRNLLPKQKIVTLVTQVEVSENDTAFKNPSKPIGPFYSASDAAEWERKGERFIQDAGRGYRKVVASPTPKTIVELPSIRALLKEGAIVIACGGGGVPVVKKQKQWVGVEAVIDKDATSALLARELKAERLLVATDVEFAYKKYGTPEQEAIRKVNVSALQSMLRKGAFAEGSMKPKIQACTAFVLATKKKAIITSLENLVQGLQEKTGTIVVP